MLAQNFKTAADLGITDIGVAALSKVLGMLEREEIAASQFDMKTVGFPECGTPGCILGWTRFVDLDAHYALAKRARGGNGLDDLFFPGMWRAEKVYAYDASREQAARALRSYLTTGEANWAEALR